MKFSKFPLSIILLLTLAFTFNSCDRGPVFEHYLKMKNSVWDRFDIKQIDIPVDKVPINYDITVVAHCTEKFQYDELLHKQFPVQQHNPAVDKQPVQVQRD